MKSIEEDNDDVEYQLNVEMNNLREAMQQGGIEPIGDLFKHEPENIRATLNAVRYMMDQRIKDANNKQDLKYRLK